VTCRNILAFGSTLMIWSSMPVVMKWTVEAYTPVTAFVLSNLVAIGIVFFVRLAFDLPSLDFNRNWRVYFWASVGISPSGLLAYWSAQYLPSSVYAIVYGLMPVFLVLISALLGSRDRINSRQWISLAISLIGLIWRSHSQIQAKQVVLLGLLVTIVSALIFVLSIVKTSDHTDSKMPTLNLVNGSLAFGLLSMAPLIPLLELVAITKFELKNFLGVVYLGGIESVMSYVSYYSLIRSVSAVTISTLFMAAPVIALLLGAWLNCEPYVLQDWLGIALVVSGLTVYFRVQNDHRLNNRRHTP